MKRQEVLFNCQNTKLSEGVSNMLEELGEKISVAVEENVEGVTPTQKEIIQYTVVQLVGEISKTVLLFGIAWLLGVGKLLLIAIFSMAIYRIPSGGAHSKSHIACFITSSILFFGNVFLSLYVRSEYIDHLYLGIFIFNLIVIYFMAPADTEMKPVINLNQRKFLRAISFICMTGTVLIGRFLITDITIRNIFVFGTMLQSITMLPFLYSILKTKYGYRDGILVPQI